MGKSIPRNRARNDEVYEAERREPEPVPLPPNWRRPVVRAVRPQVDQGRRPAKTTVGEELSIGADAFVDGHDALWCDLRYRHDSQAKWSCMPMSPTVDDRWNATLPVTQAGLYRFSVRARVDAFGTWRHDLEARAAAGPDLSVELQVGAGLIDEAATRASAADRRLLAALGGALRDAPRGIESDAPEEVSSWVLGRVPRGASLADVLFADRFHLVMGPLADPATGTTSDTYSVLAERAKARFSTWYEMFPRSAAAGGPGHGTFADVRARLDYVERMGFDVLYLPPVHPVGQTARKGRNAVTTAAPDDPGSPWAIGGAEGGHTALHPELGGIDDFRALVGDATARGIDVAIDLAFQASPDHPWVREHPSWFRHRPDGSIRYAENPPKRYEDIYPFDFESPDWPGLWAALLDVVRFWIAQGVTVFRVDNPHTKPFPFWEWLLACIRAEAPDTIFLSEAFTRPRVMEHLARLGFTQSYTYFTWRTSKWELETYLNELTSPELASYFRPNLWPNTPDILSDELQSGGRAAFLSRLVLAATLCSSYGIYGPAYELQEHVPREPGSEEYLRSEKYEIRSWDLDSPTSLSGFIALVNGIRRDHEALQFNDSLRFHWTDNDNLIAYSKARPGPDGDDVIVTVVNLDHHHARSGWVTLDLESLGIDGNQPYTAHDLLSDAHYLWDGSSNFVKLDPADVPCHIFQLSQPGTHPDPVGP
ncbi:MAG: maltotransferase domain-containing protein [Acidimicrobiales bacterium]|jgi:starch synthase (maltosyl-transferring)